MNRGFKRTRIQRVLSLGLVMALALGGLAACGKKEKQPVAKEPGAEKSMTAEGIVERAYLALDAYAKALGKGDVVKSGEKPGNQTGGQAEAPKSEGETKDYGPEIQSLKNDAGAYELLGEGLKDYTYKNLIDFASLDPTNAAGKYYGAMKNGKPEGPGAFFFKSVYEGKPATMLLIGDWKDGLLTGEAVVRVYFESTGVHISYTGPFSEGAINGMGTRTIVDDSEYTGEIKAYIITNGSLTYATGERQIGVFGYDQANGATYLKSGRLELTDGRVAEGEFELDGDGAVLMEGKLTDTDGKVYTVKNGEVQ